MASQPITLAQAQQLAQEFHDIAVTIGQYRIQQAGTLTGGQQYNLQSLQAQCIQYSTHFIALGMFAEEDDLDATLSETANSTAKAKQAIATVAVVDKVLQIATAAAILGASIASENPSAVASGIQGLGTAIGSHAEDNESGASGTTSQDVPEGGAGL
jgi:hypothetical protein